MPSDAFLKAAKKGNRQPVVLLTVESPPEDAGANKGSDAVTTQEDWQASPVFENLALDPQALGTVILKTDGPGPYASATPDPGEVLTEVDTPHSYFSAGDWSGQAVQETRVYPLDLWSGWTPPSHDYASKVTLNLVPHLFDGMTAIGNLPVVTTAFWVDIWGKLDGGAPLRLANGVKVDASRRPLGVALPVLTPGSWQFAVHLTSKISMVTSAALGYAWSPNSVYDNQQGGSYLTIRSYSADYVVGLATPRTFFTPYAWGHSGDPQQRSYACDAWTDYSFASQPRATEATLVLRPHMLNGLVSVVGIHTGLPNVCTLSFTFDVWGKKDGGAPQRLQESLSVTGAAQFQSVKLAGLARGSWQFALHVTGKVDQFFIDYLGRPGVAEVYDNGGVDGSFLELFSYTTNQQSNYLPSGYLQTRVLDLQLVPAEAPIFQADASGGSIAFAGWGSGNATDWTDLGAVHDGDTLPPYRYYYFGATFSASPDGLSCAALKEIRVAVGNYLHFSTMKDVPVKGARPYLVEGSLNALTCSIGLMEFGKVGEISPKLFWTQEVSDLIATGYLKNKAVICRIGFPELSLEDYEYFFGGTWYDYSADHEQRQISVQTRDVWKQFKTRVPDEKAYWTDDNGQKVQGKVYTLEGNIIDVMLRVVNEANVSDRYVNRDTFAAVKAAHFPDADWYVKRQLTSSQDADKLLGDLAIAAGVFLYPDTDGRLTIVHYDSAVAGEPAATLDALKYPFKPVSGGQKDLYTRQAISYQLLPGKEGSSDSDYASLYLEIDPQAESQWGEAHTKSWRDVWGIGYDPLTGKVAAAGAIVKLAQRMRAWYANPRMSVQVTGLPPKYLQSCKPGRVVAVNNLRLPAPAEEWPGFVTGKKFLIMQRGINPHDLTLTLDLFEVGPTNYLPGELPSYQVFDRYPAVLSLTADECVVQRATGAIDHLAILQFARPTDFVFGSAEVWMRSNAGPWGFVQPAAFSAGAHSWIEIPVITGNSYDFAVVTVNSAGLKQSLESSPQVSLTATGVSTIPYAPPAQHRDDPPPPIGDPQDPGTDHVIPGISGTPPDVQNLAVSGGGSTFRGLNCVFTWDRAVSDTFPLSCLQGYQVEICDLSDHVLRTLEVKDPTFSYTYGLNFDDGGLRASFKCRVRALGVNGVLSATAAVITAANSVPEAPRALATTPQFMAIGLDTVYTAPEDFDCLEVWSATVNNRASAALFLTSKTLTARHEGLATGTVRYYWIRVRDLYGQCSSYYPASATGGMQGTTLSDPTEALKLLNDDLGAQTALDYLTGKISLIDALDTQPMAFQAGAVQPGAGAGYRTAILANDRQILVQAEQIQLKASKGELSAQVDLLSDLIGLKLNATGTVSPGMAISWSDETHSRSNITFLSDTLLVARPDGTGVKNIMTTGTVNGQASVGFNANVFIDGSVSARAIATDELVVGENIAMGPNATISWAKVTSAPTIPTSTSQLTDGANLGGTATWNGLGNKPANIAALNGGEAILNSQITLTDLGGMPINPNTPTNIGPNWIYTGTLTAAQVNALVVNANTISFIDTAHGYIALGKSSASDDSHAGFWLGNSGGVAKFSIGDATSYLKWDGTNLNYTGKVNGDRIVRGRIAANGAILNGTGFTVSRLATGQYLITFTKSFGDTPTAVSTADSSGLRTTTENTSVSAGSMMVYTLSTTASTSVGFEFADAIFSFIVVGAY